LLQLSSDTGTAVAACLGILIGGSLYVLAPRYTGMTASSQESKPEGADLAQARAACDQAIARFQATMNFQTLLDELWVTGPGLKERYIRHSFDKLATNAEYDPKMAEHWLASLWNAMYLLMQYDQDHPDRPKQLQALLNKLDAAHTRTRSAKVSGKDATAEWKRCSVAADRVAEFLRKHLSPNYFGSPDYNKVTEAEAVAGKKAGYPKVLNGCADLGIGKERRVYVFYRDGFSWAFVEENGQYRIIGAQWQILGMGYL